MTEMKINEREEGKRGFKMQNKYCITRRKPQTTTANAISKTLLPERTTLLPSRAAVLLRFTKCKLCIQYPMTHNKLRSPLRKTAE